MRWTSLEPTPIIGAMAASTNLQLLVLEHIDPARDMCRYYVLSISPTLFGDTALTREWGRIGTEGRRRIELHADEIGAGEALDHWLRRKTARGYVVAMTSHKTMGVEILSE